MNEAGSPECMRAFEELHSESEHLLGEEEEQPTVHRLATPEDSSYVASATLVTPLDMQSEQPPVVRLSRGDLLESSTPALLAATDDCAPVLRRVGTPVAPQVPVENFVALGLSRDVVEALGSEKPIVGSIVGAEHAGAVKALGSSSMVDGDEWDAVTAVGLPIALGSLEACRRPLRVTRHKVVLQGYDWYLLIELSELMEAFRFDCAAALGITPECVRDVSLSSEGLTGFVSVVHSTDQWSVEETDLKLRNYHYPKTWALFPSSSDLKSSHPLDGERVLPPLPKRESRRSLKGQISADDSEVASPTLKRMLPNRPNSAVERNEKNVLPVRNRLHSVLIAEPTVPAILPVLNEAVEARDRTPTEVTAAGSAKPTVPKAKYLDKVPAAPSVDVSAVQPKGRYTVEEQSLPLDPTAMVCTRHRVGFVGERWPIVLQDERDAFTSAFIKGTADKLGFAPDTVDKVQCDNDTGDTIVTFHIKHLSTMPSKNIDVLLRTAPYEDVWKLYYGRVAGASVPRPNEIVSFHRVGFVGNKWRDVMDRDTDRFRDAFVADTAAALHISPQAVQFADYAVAEDIVVDFYVSHPSTESDEVVDDMLDSYDYHRVWSLYGISNEVDELSRNVPLVMKRSPTSRRLRSQKQSSTSLELGGPCPTCQRRWSPESGQRLGPNYSPVRASPCCAGSHGDAVQGSKDAGTSLDHRTSPSVHQRRVRNPSPATSSESRTPYQRSGQGEVVSPQRKAQTSPHVSHSSRSNQNSYTNSSLVPHPPRHRRLSSATRHRQRRVNLRELEGELSRKERERTYQERQDQLDREVRRLMTLSRTSLNATSSNTSISGSFLPPIAARYTKVRASKNGILSSMDKPSGPK
ncbi:hypothetical protein ABL78_4342 [Leptomonas seymouri]|uniref:Flagellar attachment zone protein 1 conserved domain-containing protein n=1 Tax=Leptomonas seymouri TaxID=5684 RepID=A0A0N0P5Z5_LEPSE|nr:hypothetical protein ABL78_4342 [Leptomonas seymouri]|eukprot:KPI86567.1 hypothetical protein ABL78_4342 [Leptomonas seymouri]